MAAGTAAAQAAVEIRFGQVGVASAFLLSADPELVRSELRQKVAAAPTLFAAAPLVLDLSRLPRLPDADTLRNLMRAAREAGMLPVGLAYGTTANAALAQSLDLPLFARFRQAAERAESGGPASARPPQPPNAESALHHARPVRSGQQVYARQRDLVVCAAVGNGAEIISDGSIHVYGRLSGRAVAGAQGDASARIYCQDFQAELISIAGHYRVLDDVPAEFRGQALQAWLDGERLVLEKL